MSLNSIATAVEAGAKILSEQVTAILTAMRLEWVGRGSAGQPLAGQDLGTETYPWGGVHGGELFVDDITLDGQRIVKEKVVGSKNAVISGAVRTTSGQPDFIRADGATDEATILATATPLKIVINNEIVNITSDILIENLATSPAYTDASINDSDYAAQDYTKYLGEDGKVITMTSGGTMPDDGETIAVLNTTSNEWIIGTKQTTFIENCYRGWVFDSSGDPNETAVLNDAEVLEYLQIGWLFIQNNGATVEASYSTPISSGTEPTTTLGGSALADGQYWEDLVLDTWKRYNGATWDIINRTLIGFVLIDQSDVCVASRSLDFDNGYEQTNNILLKSVDIANVGSVDDKSIINIYGEKILHNYSKWNWNLPDDLETGVEANTTYYCYLGTDGSHPVSVLKPHNRRNLLGWYHPFNNWRCVGYFTNVAGDVDQVVTELDLMIGQAETNTFETITDNSPNANAIPLLVGDIDNKIRFDPVNYHFILVPGEIYFVELDCIIEGTVGFTGATHADQIGQVNVTRTTPTGTANVPVGGWVYDTTHKVDGLYKFSGFVEGSEAAFIYVTAFRTGANLSTSFDLRLKLNIHQITQVK